jgi:hypothetical protein
VKVGTDPAPSRGLRFCNCAPWVAVLKRMPTHTAEPRARDEALPMPVMVEAEVPPGMVAGSQFVVRAPDGSSVMVTLPPGLSVGDKFHVALPDAYATQAQTPDQQT